MWGNFTLHSIVLACWTWCPIFCVWKFWYIFLKLRWCVVFKVLRNTGTLLKTRNWALKVNQLVGFDLSQTYMSTKAKLDIWVSFHHYTEELCFMLDVNGDINKLFVMIININTLVPKNTTSCVLHFVVFSHTFRLEWVKCNFCQFRIQNSVVWIGEVALSNEIKL